MVEIVPNVYQITVGQGEFPGVYAPNVFLVIGDGQAAFIDTANGKSDEIRAQLALWEKQRRPDIAAIILTHRHQDHIGGAGGLATATRGQILCGGDEREAIEQALSPRIVGTVVDGETLDLGGTTLEFIHTPGHTMGSLCVFYSQQGVLFTGDTILGTGSTSISSSHGDMGSYIESLRKLLGYDARMICPGHGPIINDPKDKIQGLIEHRLRREHQILELLRAGTRTLESLFETMYTELDHRLHRSARDQIRAHLIKLEREGKVASSGGDTFEAVREV